MAIQRLPSESMAAIWVPNAGARPAAVNGLDGSGAPLLWKRATRPLLRSGDQRFPLASLTVWKGRLRPPPVKVPVKAPVEVSSLRELPPKLATQRLPVGSMAMDSGLLELVGVTEVTSSPEELNSVSELPE